MNYALILAGGKGVRMENTDTPKQFIYLDGKPLIVYSLESAQKDGNINEICVACPSEWSEAVKGWANQYNITKLKTITNAGAVRQKTVHNGLKAINANKDDLVMIMTAVCPFVSQKTINQHFIKMREYHGCITVVKATDAITFSNNGALVSRTLQKSKMFVQQGPQTYRYGIIRQAHEIYESDENHTEVNEDSELVLNMGIDVAMVMGDRFCVKVTFPEDLAIVAALKPLFVEKEKTLL
jgi:2-C-methyl-D-erythritol 4-phosphate cytidylyltransferase